MALGRVAARLTAALVLAGAGLAMAGAAQAVVPAGACPAWDGVQPQAPGAFLFGVAMLRPCAAWAGGSTGGASMIMQLDGSSWARQPAPVPGDTSLVTAVATVSGRAAWAAVDSYAPACCSGPGGQIGHILMERWTGSSWIAQPTPQPGGKTGYTALFGVAAASADDAWAVGSYATSNAPNFPRRTLILHWNGSTWRRVPSPDPGGRRDHRLTSVTVISPTDAWAAGYYFEDRRHIRQPLMLHWNGESWRQFPLPSVGPSLGMYLFGVTATSARNAWAAGYIALTTDLTVEKSLILHWNGHRWDREPTPNPNPTGDNQLQGVAGTSARNAWAVGFTLGGPVGLMLHWNGHHWSQVPCPNPGTGAGSAEEVLGIATTSAGSAWAVGWYRGDNTDGDKALILHWDGHTWQD